jgi:peptide/nickel transport system permease protein
VSVVNPLVSNEPPLVQSKRPTGVILGALELGRTRIGLGLVLIIAAIAIFGPLIAPHGPADFIGLPNAGPSGAARFGTDHLGQDVWSRFLDGGREILLLASAATLLGLAIGTSLGLLAAYSKGALDDVLMRSMDVILAFPSIMLALVGLLSIKLR